MRGLVWLEGENFCRHWIIRRDVEARCLAGDEGCCFKLVWKGKVRFGLQLRLVLSSDDKSKEFGHPVQATGTDTNNEAHEVAQQHWQEADFGRNAARCMDICSAM